MLLKKSFASSFIFSSFYWALMELLSSGIPNIMLLEICVAPDMAWKRDCMAADYASLSTKSALEIALRFPSYYSRSFACCSFIPGSPESKPVFILLVVVGFTDSPSLKGSLSISYSLLDFLGAAAAGPPPSDAKIGFCSCWAAAGWNELKKSSPPKSMSNFFAFSDLT